MIKAFIEIYKFVRKLFVMPSELAAYSSADTIDHVIYAAKNIYTVTNAVGTYTFTIPASTTNISQYGRPLGIFSTDGGSTFTDMGDLVGGTSPVWVPPAVVVTPNSSTDGSITITVKVNNTVGGGGTFNVQVNLCVLARDTPTSITTKPTISGKVAYASSSVTGTSPRYRSIRLAGSYTSGSPTSVTSLAHGLGYIPDVNLWFNDPSSNNVVLGGNMAAGGGYLMVDGTNIYFSNFNTSYDYLYRCYKP